MVDHKKRAERRREYYEKIVSSKLSESIFKVLHWLYFIFRNLIQISSYKFTDEDAKFIWIQQ